jgi:SOS-response transcriptional repressor LexA
MDDSYRRLLVAARELRGWHTQAEIARGLTREGYAVAEAVMNNWRSRGVSKEGRLKASLIIGCRPHWVESGEGIMREMGGLNAPWEPALDANVTEGPEIIGRIPLISWVQAGTFCTSPDLFEPGDAEDWIPAIKKFGPHAYALRVQGDSMISDSPLEKSYPPGSIIFVDPDKPITNGCKVVARIHSEGEATFKKYSEDAGKRYLRPLNKDYPTITMDESMHICGVVVGSYQEE